MHIDEMAQAYIEAAIWSSTDDDGEPLDRNYSEDDIDHDTKVEMVNDVATFQRNNGFLIDEAFEEDGKGDDEIGRDFWFTRNGHGAGFWDGDYPATGDALTQAAKAFNEYDLYVGDDGTIYGGSF